MARLRPWMVVTLVGLLYALGVVLLKGGPLALVTLGAQPSDGSAAVAERAEGYDGQFVYYIARDPANAAQYLDVPAYRFQRILLPALGRALAFGQVALIPFTLLAVNLFAAAAGTAILESLLVQHKASRWYALGYGLSVGVVGSARLSLPEPLAYGLALGGILLLLRERILWSALLFALAALAKETALVVAAGAGMWLLWRRDWAKAVAFGVIALAPFATWQLILLNRLGALGIGSGGAMATSFEVVPLMGLVRILTEGGLGTFLVLGALLLPFVLIPTAWGLLRAWQDFRRRSVDLYTWLLLANAAMMLFVPFSTYREPLGILRFIVGLQIAVILYAAARHDKRALHNSTIWALTLLIGVLSDFGTRYQ